MRLDFPPFAYTASEPANLSAGNRASSSSEAVFHNSPLVYRNLMFTCTKETVMIGLEERPIRCTVDSTFSCFIRSVLPAQAGTPSALAVSLDSPF